MIEKKVIIFPYINIDKIIKMDDFEIHPYETYFFDKELTKEEKKNLNEFKNSFRQTFFEKGKIPKKVNGVGVLKYKGTILIDNYDWINDKIQILFCLMKLHISHDFWNSWKNNVNVKSFDYFTYVFYKNKICYKFGNVDTYDKIYTTIPGNINGLLDIKFYPIEFCINYIPTEFQTLTNFDKALREFLYIDPNLYNFTELYKGINNNKKFYNKFLNLSSINFGLEEQKDLFFYYAIIPTIIEILNPPKKGEKKKMSGVKYGEKLDDYLIKDNDFIETPNSEGKEWGLIARTIGIIYDTRNELLHEGKKSFDRLKVEFKGYKLEIIDIFKLIFKYAILLDFIENGIIENKFYKIDFFDVGNIYSGGVVGLGLQSNYIKISMDSELKNLLEHYKYKKEYDDRKKL